MCAPLDRPSMSWSSDSVASSPGTGQQPPLTAAAADPTFLAPDTALQQPPQLARPASAALAYDFSHHAVDQLLLASELKPEGRVFIVGPVGGAYYTLLDLLQAAGFSMLEDNLLHVGGLVGSYRFNDEVMAFMGRRRAHGPLGASDVAVLHAPAPGSAHSHSACHAAPAAAAATSPAPARGGGGMSALTAALHGLDVTNAPGSNVDQTSKRTLRGLVAATAASPMSPPITAASTIATASSTAAAAAAGGGGGAKGQLKACNAARLSAAPLRLRLPEYGIALDGSAHSALDGAHSGAATADGGSVLTFTGLAVGSAAARAAMAMGGSDTTRRHAAGLAGLGSGSGSAAGLMECECEGAAPPPLPLPLPLLPGRSVGLGAVILPPLAALRAAAAAACGAAEAVTAEVVRASMRYASVPLNPADVPRPAQVPPEQHL